MRLRQRWRQCGAYAAVAAAGFASLATTVSEGPGVAVNLDGHVVTSKAGKVVRRFRARSNAPWTIVTALITPGRSSEGAAIHVALVPDGPENFGTAKADKTVTLGGSHNMVELGQPACAVAFSCMGKQPPGLTEYHFKLAFDGMGNEVAVDYTLELQTTANGGKADYALELVEE